VYRDPRGGVWYASEVARLRVVSPAIDGPNLCLVIRFEREGEERFARWIGGDERHRQQSLHRLFAGPQRRALEQRRKLGTERLN
jgi:CelD/BcsL family acetyltransferase involved in cellulose biosynthesis